MCYGGRLKGSNVPSKCKAGSQNQSRCKNLANTRLDLINAANSLQIEGNGVLPGDPYHWGGRNTEHETIYVYAHTEFCMSILTVVDTETCAHAPRMWLQRLGQR